MKKAYVVVLLLAFPLATLCMEPFLFPKSAALYPGVSGYSQNWCLDFNGVNDSVTVSYSQVFDMHQLTIEAWVKPKYNIYAGSQISYGHAWGAIACHYPTSTDAGWYLAFSYSTGNLYFDVGYGGWGAYSAFQTNRGNWYNDSWYHVTVTFNPDFPTGNVKFYVNGTFDSQSNSQRSIVYVQTPPVLIGTYPGPPGQWYGGLMDEVRVWNISRSQSEIQRTMNRTLNMYEAKNPNLVGYWRFDENGSVLAKDYSIYQKDGTLGPLPNGSPSWNYPGAPIIRAILGDINADGVVDIYDALLLSGVFTTTSNSPNWNVNADINCDGGVDIYDALLLSGNFNKGQD